MRFDMKLLSYCTLYVQYSNINYFVCQLCELQARGLGAKLFDIKSVMV